MSNPTKDNKADALIALREQWQIKDYSEAYLDNFLPREHWEAPDAVDLDDFTQDDSPPQTISEWKSYMSELIHNNYNEDLIDQCLKDEIDNINNYKIP